MSYWRIICRLAINFHILATLPLTKNISDGHPSSEKRNHFRVHDDLTTEPQTIIIAFYSLTFCFHQINLNSIRPFCQMQPQGGSPLGCLKWTFYSLPVTWCTNSLTFNNCTFCPHCIYVFCIYLWTNSELCHLQHKLIGFCNRDEKCLLRGTNWVFK